MNFYIVRPGHRRQSLAISLASKLGRGATATVYQVQSDKKLYAAKIYHQDQNFDREKILAMLDVQPENREVVHNGQEYPQFAWPLAIIENDRGDGVGFLLPLVDIHDSFTLDHYYDKGLFKKLNSPDEGALSYKLEIARNLAQIVTELHRIGHYFIDCKPQNIRVFKRSHLVTLIDCDGFSINGKFKRYPAELLSTDYIAPEVHRRHALPSTLGEPQDRYALAVIIFQLLNQGTHPFQGIASDLNSPFNTNDEKAAAGLYPHGFIENSEIKPRPQSIHHLWDAETRRLFDQAFTTSSPTSRPSAKEWANHFEKLLFSKSLVRCKKILNNLDHIRFRDMDCPACYLENLPAFKPETKPVQVFDTTSSTSSNKLSQSSLPATILKKKFESYITSIIIGVVILYVVSLAFTSSFKNHQITDPGVNLPVPTSGPPLIPEPATSNLPSDAKRPSTTSPKQFIAIYVSQSRAVGYSIGNSSAHDAESEGLSQCIKNASKDQSDGCSKLISGFGKCLAIARAPNGAVGASIGHDKDFVMSNSRQACIANGGDNCGLPSNVINCSEN